MEMGSNFDPRLRDIF